MKRKSVSQIKERNRHYDNEGNRNKKKRFKMGLSLIRGD